MGNGVHLPSWSLQRYLRKVTPLLVTSGFEFLRQPNQYNLWAIWAACAHLAFSSLVTIYWTGFLQSPKWHHQEAVCVADSSENLGPWSLRCSITKTSLHNRHPILKPAWTFPTGHILLSKGSLQPHYTGPSVSPLLSHPTPNCVTILCKNISLCHWLSHFILFYFIPYFLCMSLLTAEKREEER